MAQEWVAGRLLKEGWGLVRMGAHPRRRAGWRSRCFQWCVCGARASCVQDAAAILLYERGFVASFGASGRPFRDGLLTPPCAAQLAATRASVARVPLEMHALLSGGEERGKKNLSAPSAWLGERRPPAVVSGLTRALGMQRSPLPKYRSPWCWYTTLRLGACPRRGS